jgi:hypothetical protein
MGHEPISMRSGLRSGRMAIWGRCMDSSGGTLALNIGVQT